MADATVGWFPVVTPVVTLLLGYAPKSISELVGHQRALEREREAREVARRDKLNEHRTDFQRQTLLDLQEALLNLTRTAGATHHEDIMAHRRTGEWQKQRIGEELNENVCLAMVRTAILGVRVHDDLVREMVQQCRDYASTVSISPSPNDSEVAMAAMGSTLEELNQRVGELLRKIDDDES
jgi:hypothetical protein